jgi:sortase (surface protein transpeptidase)
MVRLYSSKGKKKFKLYLEYKMTSVRTNVDPLQMSNLFLEEKTARLDLTSKTDFLKNLERKIVYFGMQKPNCYVICN